MDDGLPDKGEPLPPHLLRAQRKQPLARGACEARLAQSRKMASNMGSNMASGLIVIGCARGLIVIGRERHAKRTSTASRSCGCVVQGVPVELGRLGPPLGPPPVGSQRSLGERVVGSRLAQQRLASMSPGTWLRSRESGGCARVGEHTTFRRPLKMPRKKTRCWGTCVFDAPEKHVPLHLVPKKMMTR